MDELRLAGFGGQGILYMGKVLAQAGLLAGRHVTWIPSYGPEMRGGTANCSVIISDREIDEPIANHPGILVAFNGPSLDKFLGAVRPGGVVLVNSSLVPHPPQRSDVTMLSIAANDVARGLGQPGSINMVMLGALLRYLHGVDRAGVEQALRESVSTKHAHLLAGNLAALDAGSATTAAAAV